MERVDVVIVSYRSARTLHACAEPLAAAPGTHVIVVDNASDDESLDRVADLPVTAIRAPRNGGFSYGCNLGIARGTAPYVLLINPDAILGPADLAALMRVLDDDARAGLVAPRIVDASGRVVASRRRFPGVITAWGQALLLHRVWPRADELLHGGDDRPSEPDWVSGACMLVRRDVLEQLGGLDEGFFLYSEDTDLCRRIRDLGLTIRYEPAATARHVGGASAPRERLLPALARSRVRYARLHAGPVTAALHVAGIAVGEAVHAVVRGGRGHARGHLSALAAVLRAEDATLGV
jgi:GT2 family glycosyltransferase